MKRRAEADKAALLKMWVEAFPNPQNAWIGLTPGPSVEEIGERLSSAPQPFVAEQASVLALTGDVFAVRKGSLLTAAHKIQQIEKPTIRTAANLAVWVFASQELVGPMSAPLRSDRVANVLLTLSLRLAAVVPPQKWLLKAERREEAARTFLLWCGHLPAGEDIETARAQLELRDSVARESALADALADHQHRLAVARRLQEARAREAAARYSSE